VLRGTGQPVRLRRDRDIVWNRGLADRSVVRGAKVMAALVSALAGADFKKGVQQISVAQAMAFVRQRRDLNNESFTDLDRTRRQQAFIASLAVALRHNASLSKTRALQVLVEVAKKNVAVDANFDLAGFLQDMLALSDSPLALYTLPVVEFRQTSFGEDINVIDVPAIRSMSASCWPPKGPKPPRQVAVA